MCMCLWNTCVTWRCGLQMNQCITTSVICGTYVRFSLQAQNFLNFLSLDLFYLLIVGVRGYFYTWSHSITHTQSLQRRRPLPSNFYTWSHSITNTNHSNAGDVYLPTLTWATRPCADGIELLQACDQIWRPAQQVIRAQGKSVVFFKSTDLDCVLILTYS